MGDLLNETFVIYGKGFRQVIGMAVVLHAPVGLVALLVGSGLADPLAAMLAAIVLQALASFYVYGAVAFATGQQCVTGRMSVAMSYSRVWWRVVSLSAMSLIVLASITLGMLLLVFMVYWTFAVPVIIVEGRTAIEALKRSLNLVRGSWWRVFAISLVVGLVTVGLAIVASMPFVLAEALAGLIGLESMGTQIVGLGSIVGGVIAAPVPAICGTLLYYDMRVRKEEGFDLSKLASEMGFRPAEDRMEEEVTIHSKGVGQS